MHLILRFIFTLINLVLMLAIFIGTPIYLDSMWHLLWTWIPAIIVYSELQDAIYYDNSSE